jgi:hypothetical protein
MPLFRRGAWALSLLLIPTAAPAQTIEATLKKIENDLSYLTVDGPVYLAGRLPVVISGADILSSMELVSFRNFGLGLGLQTGLLTSFDRLDDNFQLVPKKLPGVVPLPQISLVGRIGIIRNLDAGVKVTFVPEFGMKFKDIIIGGGMLNVALQVRYRILEGRGARPDLVIQASFAAFSGFLKVGKDFSFEFDESVEGLGRVKGSLSMAGAPILGWTLYQVSPALVARWNAAWFHPFVGLGVDLTFGHVDGGVDLKLKLDLQAPQAATAEESLVDTWTTTAPRVFGLRPMVGFELDFTRRLKLVLQADLGYYVRRHPGDMGIPGLEEAARREAPQSLYVQTIDGEPLSPLVFAAGLGVRYDYH